MHKERTMFDLFRELASESFEYPDIEMCSDGDIITYLRNESQEDKVVEESPSGDKRVVRSAGWFNRVLDYQVSIFKVKD